MPVAIIPLNPTTVDSEKASPRHPVPTLDLPFDSLPSRDPPGRSSMHGTDLTYQILAQSRNVAAVGTLAQAVLQAGLRERRLALSALVSREEPEAADLLIKNWHRLDDDDCRLIRGQSAGVEEAIKRCLDGGESIAEAIVACRFLGLSDQIPALLKVAESSPDPALRGDATEAVLKLVEPLGESARADRAVATLRNPIMECLAESIRRLPVHKNFSLVDAFLVGSAWGDTQLRHWIEDRGGLGQTIRSRLGESENPAIADLLAGFIRRRRLEPSIRRVILRRDDDWFRDSLLRSIGAVPTGTTLKNLRSMGLPNCLADGPAKISSVLPDRRAALVHAYWAACPDCTKVIEVATEALRAGGKGVSSAVGVAFSRGPIPDAEWLMRAAMPVAKLIEKQRPEALETLEQFESERLSNPAAVLLARLIDAMQHSDAGVRKGAARMLGPLHADQMLARFDQLRPASRRRLGRIVSRIDSDSVTKVRDALRHPVLERRLEAIATAEALCLVETLGDSFAPIARDDHQLARARAANAMASASDGLTRSLLEEMLKLPESKVRDAAEDALAKRDARGEVSATSKAAEDGADPPSQTSATRAPVENH